MFCPKCHLVPTLFQPPVPIRDSSLRYRDSQTLGPGSHSQLSLSQQLYITQTSVAVMTSPSSPATTTTSSPGVAGRTWTEMCAHCCYNWLHRAGVERAVVMLLVAALFIIFLTVSRSRDTRG